MVSSPLRYPGGKSKLFGYFSQLIAQNGLFEQEYCEPYAGGAGLALRLLSDGYVRSVHLNDIDPAIYSFWKSVFLNNDHFCRLVEQTPVNIDEWYRQREIWKTCDPDDHLKLGFSTFFLNRTNRSGIIEGAGPIGGYAQDGAWKIDVRLIKSKQIANLKNLVRYKEAVHIYNEDALHFSEKMLCQNDTVTYLDPPYYIKGRKLYTNFYEDENHVEIRNLILGHMSAKWVLSYDDCTRIREIYCDLSPISYSLNYSAGRKSQGLEVIYLSDALVAPSVEGFSRAA